MKMLFKQGKKNIWSDQTVTAAQPKGKNRSNYIMNTDVVNIILFV